MKALVIALLIAAAAAAAAAPIADLQLSDGTTYHAATIVEISEGFAWIKHSGGLSKVEAEKVDLVILARAQMAIDEAAERETIARHRRILSDRKDLADARSDAAGAKKKLAEKAEDSAFTLIGTVSRVFDDGVSINASSSSVRARPINVDIVHREMRQGTGLDAHKKVPYEWVETVTRYEPANFPPSVFIITDPRRHFEGEKIVLRVYLYDTMERHGRKLLTLTDGVDQYLSLVQGESPK